MTLSEYLSETKTTVSEFARQIGVSSETARRYRNGERTPHARFMAAILEVTNGRVGPNDFFPAAKARALENASGKAA